MIVAAADANGDNVVDFDEWFDKLKSYVRAAFEALDENKDGSILDESKEGKILTSISYHFFEELLDQLFDFFDSNKDNSFSLEDDFFLDNFHLRDRNGDGKTTLSEALGVNLISLPAPIYNFYNKVLHPKDFSPHLCSVSAGPRHRREVDQSRSLGFPQQTVHHHQRQGLRLQDWC